MFSKLLCVFYSYVYRNISDFSLLRIPTCFIFNLFFLSVSYMIVDFVWKKIIFLLALCSYKESIFLLLVLLSRLPLPCVQRTITSSFIHFDYSMWDRWSSFLKPSSLVLEMQPWDFVKNLKDEDPRKMT
jgi:hypothetical protein